MNNSLIPIIAYNYGAKKEKRIHETIRCAFVFAVIIMALVFIILELIPDKILLLFDASDQMMRFGIPAVRIMSLSFFVSSIGIIFAAIFLGFGNGKAGGDIPDHAPLAAGGKEGGPAFHSKITKVKKYKKIAKIAKRY